MNEILMQVRFAADYVDMSSRLDGLHEEYDPFEVYFLKVCAGEGPALGAVAHVVDVPGAFTLALVHGSNSTVREAVSVVTPHAAPTALADAFRKYDLEDHVDFRMLTPREAAAHWNWPIRLLFLQGRDAALAYEAWEPFVVPNGIVGVYDADGLPEARAAYESLLDTERYTEWFSVNRIYFLQKQG